ncbi:hypothetical protein BJ508DRAFT_410944 [Ascobolus immersus RN42]|uniref:Uncharacterized protein n=1 Tax=Ascobolus immersus RN42 TaxID=1160509 RepID=A0A3N4IKU8_ASCIM|nr:hypothetical protein BJ508DRAFT_410944 [Ascobolus immersus RN42]
MTPFPNAFPPELILEIANYLSFPTLLKLANSNQPHRRLLRKQLLQRWGREYRDLCIMERACHIGSVPAWRQQLGEDGLIVGKPEWKPFHYPSDSNNEGPIVWFFGHWLIWFLVNGVDEDLEENLGVALEGPKNGILAINLLRDLMDLHAATGYWQRKIWHRSGILGREYSRILRSESLDPACKDREDRLLKALIAIARAMMAGEEDCLVASMREEIWPDILQGRVRGRFLQVLKDCGLVEGKIPFDELERFDKSGKYVDRMNLLCSLIPAFPSYLNTRFTYRVSSISSRVPMDAATYVAYLAYEWLLDSQFAHEDDDEHAPFRKEWRLHVGETLTRLTMHGASLERALRFCIVDKFPRDYEYHYLERLERGNWEVVLLLLAAGVDPNAINPPEDEEEETLMWTPLHICVPTGYDKKLFYAFLDAGYDGIEVRNEEGLTPVEHLVYSILDETETPGSQHDEWLSEYLHMLEALVARRPECLEQLEWINILHLVQKERESGRNEELVRIVDEAEKKRSERTGTEPGLAGIMHLMEEVDAMQAQGGVGQDTEEIPEVDEEAEGTESSKESEESSL